MGVSAIPAKRASGQRDLRDAMDSGQINAIVKGGLGNKTAIFISWDDWGGWYDHVTPPNIEKWTDASQFRYGSRVPCLVLSPYTKAGYISKRFTPSAAS